MIQLREISVLWSLIHVLVIFIIFYEPRYSRKKTTLLTLCCMGPLLLFNFLLFIFAGPAFTGQVLIFTLTIPSLIFFYILAKHRDGRFFFTFCLADTAALAIIDAIHIIDFYISNDTHLVMLLLRLILFPLLEWAALKWLRGPYIEIQKTLKKGWGGFALITAMFYLLLILMFNFPTVLTERQEYIPTLVLVLILMPIIYWCIFVVLFRQHELFQLREQEQLLLLQASRLQQRLEQISHTEEQMSIQRHDLRHRFQTLDMLIEKGDTQAVREYIVSSEESLMETKIRRWCLNPVLDAVFAAYFQQAESEQIRIDADLDIPEELPVPASELSIAFANALENAIHAVKKLSEEQRIIRCKCIRYPQLMFRMSNPYTGKVQFDVNHQPVSDSAGHGLGTRSIAAYCKKHGAFCDYKAENGWFTIQIVQP